jgi:hypothetical protein
MDVTASVTCKQRMEDALLAWTALPGGASASVWLQPQLEAAYQIGHMPPLLPGPT